MAQAAKILKKVLYKNILGESLSQSRLDDNLENVFNENGVFNFKRVKTKMVTLPKTINTKNPNQLAWIVCRVRAGIKVQKDVNWLMTLRDKLKKSRLLPP